MEDIKMPVGILKELEEPVSDTEESVQMPVGMTEELKGDDIKDTLQTEVKTSLMREVQGTSGGYLLDLTHCGPVMPCAMIGLKSMIGTGDKSIPLYIKVQDKIICLGYGDADVINLNLEGYVRQVFDEQARLFIYDTDNKSYKLAARGDIRFKKLRL